MDRIETAHLFPTLDGRLIELLEGLEPGEWELPTVAPRWKVRDVAAHLLDTALRRLSLGRDGFFTEAPEGSLADFINRINQRGVETYGRLSSPVLISLMRTATGELAEHFPSLDPAGAARFAVSWAGEDVSLHWFDTAREYTERWHHQQQIRLATGRPGIFSRELYHPVLDCFLRALPHHYRGVEARDGSLIRFEVTGDAGGVWNLARQDGSWKLVESAAAPNSTARIPQEIAWRIFTKGMDRKTAESLIEWSGTELARHVLSLIAVVA